MTRLPAPETGPMLFADCPFCDAPAVVDQENGTFDCAACAVHFVFDEPAEPIALAPAA